MSHPAPTRATDLAAARELREDAQRIAALAEIAKKGSRPSPQILADLFDKAAERYRDHAALLEARAAAAQGSAS